MTTLDLGRTEALVALEPAGIRLPDGRVVAWTAAGEAIDARNACFEVGEQGSLSPIRLFSATTNRVCQLCPTTGAPTMLLAGFYMHRVKASDPLRDTDAKLAAIRPLIGAVLDTATGLGYTAIAASRTATTVTTIELDPAVIEIARRNPWSAELFERRNIELLAGDAADILPTLRADSFDRVIHDPPVVALAGDLYGLAFYREVLRVIRPGGRLFHYVGSPDSASAGRVGRGVVRRLREAGFGQIKAAPAAFGFVAEKQRRH